MKMVKLYEIYHISIFRKFTSNDCYIVKMAAVMISSNPAGQFFISLNLPTINCRISGRLQPDPR